ncbi:hypothetical protein D3C85_1941450 [compost metagenome]
MLPLVTLTLPSAKPLTSSENWKETVPSSLMVTTTVGPTLSTAVLSLPSAPRLSARSV